MVVEGNDFQRFTYGSEFEEETSNDTEERSEGSSDTEIRDGRGMDSKGMRCKGPETSRIGGPNPTSKSMLFRSGAALHEQNRSTTERGDEEHAGRMRGTNRGRESLKLHRKGGSTLLHKGMTSPSTRPGTPVLHCGISVNTSTDDVHLVEERTEHPMTRSTSQLIHLLETMFMVPLNLANVELLLSCPKRKKMNCCNGASSWLI